MITYVVHGLLLLCFLQGAEVEAFLSHAHLSAIGGRGRVADVAVRPFQGRCPLHNLCAQTKAAKTFSSKEFNVNWNRPDAQGTFGRVYFAKQGMMGMGGQVVLKSPPVVSVYLIFLNKIFLCLPCQTGGMISDTVLEYRRRKKLVCGGEVDSGIYSRPLYFEVSTKDLGVRGRADPVNIFYRIF
jgi:hypothetical protein